MHALESHLARFPKIEDPLRRKFAAMHSAMDDNIGKVMAALRGHGLEDRTLVIFVSDNGGPTSVNGSRNGPLRGFKAQTWEGGIRVPFIVQWKGTVPAGQVYRFPVMQIDLAPTALAAAGEDVPSVRKLDGVNLLPYVTGKNANPPHEALYWRFGAQMAVRVGDWKLVKAPGAGADGPPARGVLASTDGAHLYNLATDVGEQSNVASAQPETARRLAEAWRRWSKDLEEPRWLPGRLPARTARQP